MKTKTKKYYFRENDEYCYKLKDYIDYMRSENVIEMKLCEAKRVKDLPFFFCKYYDQVGEKNSCSKFCNGYKPRNDKTGVCKHYGYVYEPTNNWHLIKINVYNQD